MKATVFILMVSMSFGVLAEGNLSCGGLHDPCYIIDRSEWTMEDLLFYLEGEGIALNYDQVDEIVTAIEDSAESIVDSVYYVESAVYDVESAVDSASSSITSKLSTTNSNLETLDNTNKSIKNSVDKVKTTIQEELAVTNENLTLINENVGDARTDLSQINQTINHTNTLIDEKVSAFKTEAHQDSVRERQYLQDIENSANASNEHLFALRGSAQSRNLYLSSLEGIEEEHLETQKIIKSVVKDVYNENKNYYTSFEDYKLARQKFADDVGKKLSEMLNLDKEYSQKNIDELQKILLSVDEIKQTELCNIVVDGVQLVPCHTRDPFVLKAVQDLDSSNQTMLAEVGNNMVINTNKTEEMGQATNEILQKKCTEDEPCVFQGTPATEEEVAELDEGVAFVDSIAENYEKNHNEATQQLESFKQVESNLSFAGQVVPFLSWRDSLLGIFPVQEVFKSSDSCVGFLNFSVKGHSADFSSQCDIFLLIKQMLGFFFAAVTVIYIIFQFIDALEKVFYLTSFSTG